MGVVRKKKGSWRWFAILCLIASSRWIFENRYPEVGSTLRTEAWSCGILAVLTLAAALAGKRRRPTLQESVRLMIIGGGLLAVPAFGVLLGGAAGDSFNRAVALCLVPVIVLVLSGVWSDSAPSALSFWPGLVGLGGAMLVFPLMMPTNVFGYVGLLAPPVVVGAACVACRKIAKDIPGEWSAAMLLAGGAIALVLMEARRVFGTDVAPMEFPWGAVAIDVVVSGFTVLVVLQIDAIRYASRYFVIPLLTIVEGLLILREGVTFRLCVGLALLVVASAALLRGRDYGDSPAGLGLNS